jgi:arsenate reductase
MARRVLFLCTGNSCRSQMAEAIVNSGRAGDWEAVSAGSRPAGFVHPLAVRVLSEIGVEVRGARSKPVSEFHGQPFDLVVTVCSSAAEECPVWLGQGRRVHQEYPDPAKAEGDEARALAAFRSVRDAMLRDLPVLLERGA